MDLTRQRDLVPEGILATPIKVIGAGAIGSFVTLALAKIGFSNITVWDFDMVEEHNIPNQFYPLSSVGQSKTFALGKMVKEFTGTRIVEMNEPFVATQRAALCGVVIMAVDSMTAREEIWKACHRNSGVLCVVDGRMGGNQFEVYTVVNGVQADIERYLRSMPTEQQAASVRCTEKAVMYNVLCVAGFMANQVRLVLTKKEYERGMIMDLETMTFVQMREVGV